MSSTGADVKYKCTTCQEVKGKDDFYKKQWKLKGEGSMCKPCWDNRDPGPPKKQRAVEYTCVTCSDKFEATKGRRKRAEGGCDNCAEKARLRRVEEERKRLHEKKVAYHMTYGVGYENPLRVHLPLKSEPLERDVGLAGEYSLVFYASDATASSGREDIHRTARGSMNLSVDEWGGKDALCGSYFIDTRKTNGKDDVWAEKIGWGETTSANFIETVHNYNPVFSAFANNEREGRMHFVMVRNGARPYWWERMHLQEPYHDLLTASIDILDERVALGRSDDSLYYNEYSPAFVRRADTLEMADEMMARYRDGKNSWMCRHLGLPADVSLMIRKHVTPSPVFYLEEGDLILHVEEREEPEWEKMLVFRKET